MSVSFPGLQESRPRGRFSFHSPAQTRCAVDPRLPHELVDQFCAIDFESLAQRGIRYACLDLDNTLLPQTGEVLDPAIKAHLHRAREQGWLTNVCLISNVIWKKRRGPRLYRLAQELEVPLVYAASFWTRKPSRAPFEWALEAMRSTPQETAMVGDQVFADIVGGNRMGFYTILVKPISSDHWTTRFAGRRLRESLLLRHYMIKR